MTVRQLSIFMENKSGTLLRVLNLLKEAGISLIASNIADTVEYGICRILCGDPQRAHDVLRQGGVAVALSDVFAIEMDNKVGRAADVISTLADQGLSITYLYSFLVGGHGVIIFRTDDNPRAANAIEQSQFETISEEQLDKLASEAK